MLCRNELSVITMFDMFITRSVFTINNIYQFRNTQRMYEFIVGLNIHKDYNELMWYAYLKVKPNVIAIYVDKQTFRWSKTDTFHLHCLILFQAYINSHIMFFNQNQRWNTSTEEELFKHHIYYLQSEQKVPFVKLNVSSLSVVFTYPSLIKVARARSIIVLLLYPCCRAISTNVFPRW